MKCLEELLDLVKGSKKTAYIAGSNDEHVLDAVKAAVEKDLIIPVLIGPADETKRIASQLDFDISKFELIDKKEEPEIAQTAVSLISSRGGDIVIKGLINTGVILKYVLNKEYGLNAGGILSHIAIMEIPGWHKLILLTDAALNIEPDLDQKLSITKNAANVARSIGIQKPKIALIAANEKISFKMKATYEAAVIDKMVQRGEIKDCIIDGPLALDIAVSKEAQEIKKIQSPVDGDADILVVPDIDAGNVLYKSIIHFAKAEVAGIICGARKPIVVTSRADSAQSKLYSIALACAYKG